ncbi:hypothetical protein BSU04_11250 [Caballeronia sordidicola]|uniref:Uncharacterized protein n=1 Tax=Caballeronia sordidicola TaxID=196367 RepID=A0A226X551_CABSO|nr:hypothetical protein BSU04_11250 [Caballeronia sordidicola]
MSPGRPVFVCLRPSCMRRGSRGALACHFVLNHGDSCRGLPGTPIGNRLSVASVRALPCGYFPDDCSAKYFSKWMPRVHWHLP